MHVATIELNDKQLKAVNRVMDTLDRWDQRMSGNYRFIRKHSRNTFRALVTILVSTSELGVSHDHSHEMVFLQAFARNVSQGGMAFLYPERMSLKRITVGIAFSENLSTWFLADVVRSRQVMENFWEYGVAFRERVEAPENAPPLSFQA